MNPYALLGVAPDATDQVISAAYHHELKLHHPDRFATASAADRLIAEEMTRQLNEAMARIRSDRASGWFRASPGIEDDDGQSGGGSREEREVERLSRLASSAGGPSMLDMLAGRLGERAQKAPQPVERLAVVAGALVVIIVMGAVISLLVVLF